MVLRLTRSSQRPVFSSDYKKKRFPIGMSSNTFINSNQLFIIIIICKQIIILVMCICINITIKNLQISISTVICLEWLFISSYIPASFKPDKVGHTSSIYIHIDTQFGFLIKSLFVSRLIRTTQKYECLLQKL